MTQRRGDINDSDKENRKLNQLLAKTRGWCRLFAVKTLTVEEATPGLGRLVDLALAGEQIQIRKGTGVVELRPTLPSLTTDAAQLSPREALQQLQKGARLTAEQAESYQRELREERLAAEDRRPT